MTEHKAEPKGYHKKYPIVDSKSSLHISEEGDTIKFHTEMLYPYYIKRDDLLIVVRDYLEYYLKEKTADAK